MTHSAMLPAAALLCLTLVARSAQLQVPRCCNNGQRLDVAQLPPEPSAEQVVAACVAAPEAVWAPPVYAPARAMMLPRNFVPKHWIAAESAFPVCDVLRVLSDLTAPYVLLANNASLWLRNAGRSLAPTKYCVDISGAVVCAEDFQHAPSKCCGPGRKWDGGSHCVEDEKASAEAEHQLEVLAGRKPSVGWPACPGGAGFDELGALTGASLHTNGALLLGGAELAAGTWCAEAAPTGEGARVLACAGSWRGEDEAHLPVYGVALAVGALFLAATLAASLALPAAHHALHWRCQTHYVAALMLGDALLAGTQLAGAAVPPTLCRVLAVTMHFLFLSAFFWLNTMCFNIWWTFRDFRPTSVERGQEAWRLRVYSVYAWGAPLLLAGAGALLDALPGAAHLLRPRFGERRCWFAGDVEILAYFFGPVGLLLLINLALFASTTRQLTCGLWRRDEVKSTAERAALGRVCAKLVVVMGVTWGADVLSWAVGGPRYLWYATDLLNALQGVLIFLVVGCQRHALSALRARLRRGPGRPRPPHPLTHSSTQLPSCGESLTQTTPAPQSAAALPPAPALAQKVPMETVC